MGEAWTIGPFMIKEQWLLYAASGIVAYVVIWFAIKQNLLVKSQLDVLWNGFIVFAVIWKFSYGLIHPLSVWQHPLGALYFTGGSIGIVLGFLGVLVYFLCRLYKYKQTFNGDMASALLAYLAAYGTYQLLNVLLYQQHVFSSLILVCVIVGLIVYGFVIQKRHPAQNSWPQILLWYSLLELMLSYFIPQLTGFLSFSLAQWVWIVMSVSMMMILFQKSESKN